jgi:hypothetical protein
MTATMQKGNRRARQALERKTKARLAKASERRRLKRITDDILAGKEMSRGKIEEFRLLASKYEDIVAPGFSAKKAFGTLMGRSVQLLRTTDKDTDNVGIPAPVREVEPKDVGDIPTVDLDGDDAE